MSEDVSSTGMTDSSRASQEVFQNTFDSRWKWK